MSGVNWNALNNMPNPGATFVNAFQQARQNKMAEQQMAEDREIRKEDREYLRQTRESEARTRQLQQAREQLGIMSRLLEGATDPVSYEQARQNAVALGLDVSKVPPQFDPNWVTQTKQQAQALLGQVDQELMAVAPGTTVIDKKTGKPVYQNPRPPRYYPVPQGGKLVLDPSYGGGSDEDEWEIIDGGQTPPASGPFQP